MAVICDVCGDYRQAAVPKGVQGSAVDERRRPEGARSGVIVHRYSLRPVGVGGTSVALDLCVVCADLIRAGYWAALADRAEHY